MKTSKTNTEGKRRQEAVWLACVGSSWPVSCGNTDILNEDPVTRVLVGIAQRYSIPVNQMTLNLSDEDRACSLGIHIHGEVNEVLVSQFPNHLCFT